MPPETKTDCETKKISVSEKLAVVTISFVYYQKPHSLQPNQIYNNLVEFVFNSYL
jgi:hypothetical protein